MRTLVKRLIVLFVEINLNTCVSNGSAIRYRLDSFEDLSNKVVYLVNKYLNYTERSIAVVISHSVAQQGLS